MKQCLAAVASTLLLLC